MKKLLLSVLTVFVALSCAFTAQAGAKKKADKQTQVFRYDIEYVKNAGDGMSNVKVWSYGKSVKVAEERCKANAVHGVIFKGYTGQGAAQPALVKNASGYSDNKDFFDNFFNSGDYLRYVSSVVNGSTESRKIKNGGFKVSQTMTVNVKMLRRHLEQAGIIRGLSSGF